MRGKKIGIIIIIIFLIVAIVAGVFAYLFLATDIFKGNKKLFFKIAVVKVLHGCRQLVP